MKVIVTAGGTYGHINPALSLILHLKTKKLHDILLVSPNEELKENLAKENILTYVIANCKINTHSIMTFIGSIFRLFKAMGSCFNILRLEKPQVVIGFGGYASFPLVMAACILRIPAAIHEQNVSMGRANRLLSYFVKKVLVSFEETKKFAALTHSGTGKKTVLVGNPIRPQMKRMDKKKALEYLGLDSELFTVLVMGGTAGAHNINEKFIEALGQIENDKLQVIHITGQRDLELARRTYAKMGFKNKVVGFSDQISYMFSAADILISRAGASTISEISYFKLPAILIPYPYAGAHQLANAKVLVGRNQALMIEEKNLNSRNLGSYIVDFINNSVKLAALREGFTRSKTGNKEGRDLDNNNILLAVNRLADELLMLVKKRNPNEI